MTTARSVGAAGVGGWLAMVLLTVACGSQPTAVPAARASGVTALVGGRVQPSPDAATIADGVVLISQGVITAVGTRAEIAVPPGAIVIDCAGTTVTSGFWNSHVHFTGLAFQQADLAPADGLTEALRAMLTSWGVVHAVDTGSFLDNTLALRRRDRPVGRIPVQGGAIGPASGPMDTVQGGATGPAGRAIETVRGGHRS